MPMDAVRTGQAWREAPGEPAHAAELAREAGRGGEPTLRLRGVYLHSRYRPREEAQRLAESAELHPERPLLVLGLGLGYHLDAFKRAPEDVLVLEPEPAVLYEALRGPIQLDTVRLGTGTPESLLESPELRSFAKRVPQVFVHPATAALHPEWIEKLMRGLAGVALDDKHLSVAIVGPMFGGSLPLLDYLTRAFTALGHRVLPVDNAIGWPLYDAIHRGVINRQPKRQLNAMAEQLMAEWTYARVAEFAPEFVVVLAQAPVANNFPARMRQRGALSAYWFVENWRHMPYWQHIAPGYDAFFHIQPGDPFEQRLNEHGCAHHAFVQTGCDAELHRPISLTMREQEEFGCDISFAGAGYGNRLNLFAGLTDYNFKIWGVGWSGRELAPLVRDPEQRFDNEKFMRIIAASKISLNLHSSATAEGVDPEADALNPRVFEIAAAGGFQVCDPCRGLESHFAENEILRYASLRELRALIDKYLAAPEERAAIAQRARARALAEHTYTHRAKAMLDFLIERHGARVLNRGVRIQRTIGEVLDTLPSESILRAWLKTLPQDELFLQERLAERTGFWTPGAPDAAKMFRYLCEVRSFAETLLADKS